MRQTAEERRTKKIKKLIGKLDGAIAGSEVTKRDMDEAIASSAKTIASCRALIDWNGRN